MVKIDWPIIVASCFRPVAERNAVEVTTLEPQQHPAPLPPSLEKLRRVAIAWSLEPLPPTAHYWRGGVRAPAAKHIRGREA